MKCPNFDFHIHTKYLGCATARMEIPSILRECKRLGVVSLAITDHLNSLDKLELHVPIRKDIEKLSTDVEVYFGVELKLRGYNQGYLFNQGIKEKYGFQFAMGGIHFTFLKEHNLKKLIDIQHKHHLRACQDSLVDVLVHPYWFNEGEFDKNGWPRFNSMKVVPEACVRELGQASRETGTAIEINGCSNLKNPAFSEDYVKEYFDYLSILTEEGAIFSLASDAHDLSDLVTIQDVWQVVERLNLSPDRIWRPKCNPMTGGRAKR